MTNYVLSYIVDDNGHAVRWYVDGKRVSREAYYDVERKCGCFDTFYTQRLQSCRWKRSGYGNLRESD